MSTRDYPGLLRKLLPPGDLLTRARDSRLGLLLEGLGRELERVDGRACRLIDEVDPRSSSELLGDWERLLGLPDPCAGELEGLEARRAAVVGRLVDGGGQSVAAYVALAAALGESEVLIEEHRPGQFGRSRFGAARFGPAEVRHTWTVHLPAQRPQFDSFGAAVFGASRFGRFAQSALLECAFERARPAHTIVSFAYDLDVFGAITFVVALDENGLPIRIQVVDGAVEMIDENGEAITWVSVPGGLRVIDESGYPITMTQVAF